MQIVTQKCPFVAIEDFNQFSLPERSLHDRCDLHFLLTLSQAQKANKNNTEKLWSLLSPVSN